MGLFDKSDLQLDKPGRGRIYNNIIETFGNTPLVRLNRLSAGLPEGTEVLAKLEFFNPMSSIKDRIAVAMIESLEADGTIGPGSVIVEPTSGNTGIGLAFVCAAKGYRCILTMPDSFSVERRRMLIMLGAELVLTPKEKGIKASIDKAQEIVDETPNAVMPWQFGNEANPEVHRITTGEEIWSDTGGKIDAFVYAVGTGGTITGVGGLLKERNPDMKLICLEPELSQVVSGKGEHSPHMIQGIGAGFIPPVLDTSQIDDYIAVSNENAMETAKQMSLQEGIPCGISSGAMVWGALEYAKRPEMAGKRIVTVVCDFAERYISTALFDGIDA